MRHVHSVENLTSVNLCEGVKTVGDAAFQDCWILKTVSLPASLEFVDGWAFGDCLNLKFIECNGMTPPNMHSDAFINLCSRPDHHLQHLQTAWTEQITPGSKTGTEENYHEQNRRAGGY
jgi:hypothetical protein